MLPRLDKQFATRFQTRFETGLETRIETRVETQVAPRAVRQFRAAAAERLIGDAHRTLDQARLSVDEGERYAAAHLAALRTAAAVLADRARPTAPKSRRARRPTSAWVLLGQTAPELGEWATFFASGAGKRAAAQAGLRGAVSTREADDLCRDVAEFIAVVEAGLGMLPLDPVSRAAAPGEGTTEWPRPLR